MDANEFESGLIRDGYEQAITEGMPANCFNDFHTHAFHVRALVLAGEITLTVGSEATRYRAGEVFVMTAGEPHQENVGSDGVRYIYARRDVREVVSQAA